MTTHHQKTRSRESNLKYVIRESGLLRTLLLGLGPPLLGAWLVSRLPQSKGRELIAYALSFLIFLGLDLLILYVLTLRRRLNECWDREDARLGPGARVLRDLERLPPLMLAGKVELAPLQFVRDNAMALRHDVIVWGRLHPMASVYTKPNEHYEHESQRYQSTGQVADSMLDRLAAIGMVTVENTRRRHATLTEAGREALDMLLEAEAPLPHPTHK